MDRTDLSVWRDRLRPRKNDVLKTIENSDRLQLDCEASMPWTVFLNIILTENLNISNRSIRNFIENTPTISVLKDSDLITGVRDTLLDPIGKCCFCSERCNPCSQTCGFCARRLHYTCS